MPQKKDATDAVMEQLRPEVTAPSSARRWVFVSLVVGILGGALAGAGAGFWILQVSNKAAEGDSSPSPAIEAVKPDAQREEPVFERAVKSVIGIYKNPGKADTVNALLFRSEGVPLTSDGWVAVPTGVVAGDGVVWNRHWYSVEKTIEDPFTGIIFLKVKASGFPLTPFAPRERLKDGDRLAGYTKDGGVFESHVVLARFIEAPDTASRAENLNVFARISEGPVGAPLFDAKGELAGISLGEGKMALASSIESALKMILKEGKVRRPFFGASFVDRSSQIFTQTPLLGALIASSKDAPAVERGSPASAAGLKEGDVIVAVENLELNQNQTIAEVLIDFVPGTKVAVKYLRGGKEDVVSVTLGEKN